VKAAGCGCPGRTVTVCEYLARTVLVSTISILYLPATVAEYSIVKGVQMVRTEAPIGLEHTGSSW
jgi:hypothetical protein